MSELGLAGSSRTKRTFNRFSPETRAIKTSSSSRQTTCSHFYRRRPPSLDLGVVQLWNVEDARPLVYFEDSSQPSLSGR